MPIKVEAAVVTQKRPSAGYNTDSINVNGKVFSREIIKNGYKGSGIISGNSYFALTSSAVEGFADATVAAFNDRAEIFAVARDARSVFSGFYEDCRSALIRMNRSEDDLASVCLYASGRKVVLSTNYESGLYILRLGVCTPVTAQKVEDTVADYKSSVFSDVAPGDIFILTSPGVSQVLTEKDIEDICKVSDGSVKKIVSLILKVALAKEGTGAVSAFAVKILETALEDEAEALGFASVFTAGNNADNKTVAEDAAKAIPGGQIYDEEKENKTITLNENSENNAVAVDAPEESDNSKDKAAELVQQTVAAENSDVEVSENTYEDVDRTVSLPEDKTDTDNRQYLDPDDVFNIEVENVETAESRADAVAAAISESAKEQYAEMLIEDAEADMIEETGDSEEDGEEEKKSGGKRVKLFIALVALVALSVFLFVVIFFVRGLGGENKEDDPVNGTEESSTAQEENLETESQSNAENITTQPSTEETSSEEETSEEDTTAAREEPTSAEEEPTSAEEEPTSAEEEPTSAEEEPTSAEEEPTSAEEEPTSAEEEPTSAEEEPTSAEEESISAEEEPTSAGEEPTSAEEEPTSAEEEPASAENESVSAE